MEISIDQLVEDFRIETEKLFGKAINDWNYSGLEFRSDGPSLLYYRQVGEIAICLSDKVKTDAVQIIFQLAHETCHLLHPSIEYPSFFANKTTFLNEGISTYYQVKKMSDFFDLEKVTVESLKDLNYNYYEAYILVNELITKDPDSIKKLRTQMPRIDKLKIQDFDVLDFEVSKTSKIKLISSF